MDKIKVIGGKKLEGKIYISGAKNAALPLMTAALLTDEPVTLTNMPILSDINSLCVLLEQHGSKIEVKDEILDNHETKTYTFTTKKIKTTKAPYEIVRKMRASYYVLGPLLAREGKVELSLPGGCAIGARPMDLHLSALEKMGAKIEIKKGYVHAKVRKRLKGAHIIFPKVTVGGTCNLLMAATLAKGTTKIENAAKEPEVNDLANLLISMGAKIYGIGTSILTIEGVDKLHGANHKVVPDRIEAGSYAMAAAITRGKIELINACPRDLATPISLLRDIGVKIEETKRGFIIDANKCKIIGKDVMTEPFPGFPTDLQAQFTALMTTADGASLITETIFENRFMHVPELLRMGADINIHGHGSAIVRGVKKLSGAEVMATDLRASFALILAGLVADGTTIVNRVYHLDRGYEKLEEKLAAVGANIKRIKE